MQAIPSLQSVPSLLVTVHAGVPLHERVTQGGELAQTMRVPPHAPAPLHWSPQVQRSPSVHGVPVGAGGLEQVPVAGLQVPAT